MFLATRVSMGGTRFPWIAGNPSHTAQTCLSLFLIFCGFVMPDFIASAVRAAYVLVAVEEARRGEPRFSSQLKIAWHNMTRKLHSLLLIWHVLLASVITWFLFSANLEKPICLKKEVRWWPPPLHWRVSSEKISFAGHDGLHCFPKPPLCDWAVSV